MDRGGGKLSHDHQGGHEKHSDYLTPFELEIFQPLPPPQKKVCRNNVRNLGSNLRIIRLLLKFKSVLKAHV